MTVIDTLVARRHRFAQKSARRRREADVLFSQDRGNRRGRGIIPERHKTDEHRDVRRRLSMQIWPGEPYPLGATFDGTGTNFSLFSEVAERVELCLFDETGREARADLPEVDGFRWHGYLPHIEPGQRYGFRVYGPWAPEKGQRCNPAKLLLDPYAKAIEGGVEWDEAVFPYWFDNPEGPPNDRDSAPFVPRSVVVSPYFDWGNERPPRRPLEETIIYEA